MSILPIYSIKTLLNESLPNHSYANSPSSLHKLLQFQSTILTFKVITEILAIHHIYRTTCGKTSEIGGCFQYPVFPPLHSMTFANLLGMLSYSLPKYSSLLFFYTYNPTLPATRHLEPLCNVHMPLHATISHHL